MKGGGAGTSTSVDASVAVLRAIPGTLISTLCKNPTISSARNKREDGTTYRDRDSTNAWISGQRRCEVDVVEIDGIARTQSFSLLSRKGVIDSESRVCMKANEILHGRDKSSPSLSEEYQV